MPNKPGPNGRRSIGALALRIGLLPACAVAMVSTAQAMDNGYRLAVPIGEVRSSGKTVEPYQLQAADYRLIGDVKIEPAPAPASPAPDKPFAKEVLLAASEAGVEPDLVHALIEVESAYRPHAVSPKGAVGLMQLLPETAQRYGVSNLTSVPDNLRAGTRHLRTLLDIFGERLDLVLAAYNAGEGAVRKYKNTIPPYRETRDYVPAVLKRYRKPEIQPVEAKRPEARAYMPGTRLNQAAFLGAP